MILSTVPCGSVVLARWQDRLGDAWRSAPGAPHIVDAELIGVAWPPGGWEEGIAHPFSSTGVGALELVVDRRHGRLRDPPAQAGLHIGGGGYYQGRWCSPRLVIIIAMPGRGTGEAFAPAIGDGTAATGLGILWDKYRRGSSQDEAEQEFFHG